MHRAEVENWMGGTGAGMAIDFGPVNDDMDGFSDNSLEIAEDVPKPGLWARLFNSSYVPLFIKPKPGEEELASMAGTDVLSRDTDPDEMQIIAAGPRRRATLCKWLPCIAACCCLVTLFVYLITVLTLLSSAGKKLHIEYTGGAELRLTCNGKQAAGGDFALTGLTDGLGIRIEEVEFYFSGEDHIHWARLGPIDRLNYQENGDMRVDGEAEVLSIPAMQEFINSYLAWRVTDAPRPTVHLEAKGWISTRLLPFPLPLSIQTDLDSPHTGTFLKLSTLNVTVEDEHLSLSSTVKAHGYHVWNAGVPFTFSAVSAEGVAQGSGVNPLVTFTTSLGGEGQQLVDVVSSVPAGRQLGELLSTDMEKAVFNVSGHGGSCLPQQVVGGIRIRVPASHFSHIGTDDPDAKGFPFTLTYGRGVVSEFSEDTFKLTSEVDLKRLPNDRFCTLGGLEEMCECVSDGGSDAEEGDTCRWAGKPGTPGNTTFCKAECNPPPLPIFFSGDVALNLATHNTSDSEGVGHTLLHISHRGESPLGSLPLSVQRGEASVFTEYVLTPLMNTMSLDGDVCLQSAAQEGTWVDSFISGIPLATRCVTQFSKPLNYGLCDIMLDPHAFSPEIRKLAPPAVDRHVTQTGDGWFDVTLKQALPAPGPVKMTFSPFKFEGIPDITLGSVSASVGGFGTALLSTEGWNGAMLFDISLNVSVAEEGVRNLVAGRPSQHPVDLLFGGAFKLGFALEVQGWSGVLLNSTTAANPFPVELSLKKGARLMLKDKFYTVDSDVTIRQHRLQDNADGGEGPFRPRYTSLSLSPSEAGSVSASLEVQCPGALPTLPGDFSCVCSDADQSDCMMRWSDIPAEACPDGTAPKDGWATVYDTCSSCVWCTAHSQPPVIPLVLQ
eukprot:TRINITY_DN28145_c0_g1_i1.p1 TRINITY_DN28145_c0_g1~~TRINITY_DN28145_c0_g1_i1.p1  ORF type:complete len:889 (+),score=289.67 TRINITY_DN28145_c0_g1_i1:203-2869(+)